jgi:hypothetical protein
MSNAVIASEAKLTMSFYESLPLKTNHAPLAFVHPVTGGGTH